MTPIANLSSQIHHENIRLTVIVPLEKAFDIKTPQPSTRPDQGVYLGAGLYQSNSSVPEAPFHPFLDTYKRRFLWYLESYKVAIEQGLNDKNARSRHSFPLMQFEGRDNIMGGYWDYEDMKKRLGVLELRIMEETQKWPVQGKDMDEKDHPLAASLRAQSQQITRQLSQRTEGMVVLELVDGNPFLWRLIYHGRPMTQFDGGVLKINIFISPNHPAEQPRVILETPLYHVRVSPQNVLIYLPLRADEMSRHVDGIISSLEEYRPPVNPLMTVNPEASALCWGSKEEQRQYSRKLRRSVAATLE